MGQKIKKIERTVWSLLVVLLGLASTVWGLTAFFVHDLPLGSKFTPAGRDLSIITLAVILGIFSVLWGLADLQIRRHHAAKKHDTNGTGGSASSQNTDE